MLTMAPALTQTMESSIRPHSSLAYSHPSFNLSTSSLSSCSSTATVSALPSLTQGEEVTLDGLQHSELRLEARKYKTPQFAADLLHLLRNELHLQSWRSSHLEVSGLKIFKISGSLTNAVFFVSHPTSSGVSPRTILLRIYGPSSAVLISRPHELRTLHMLSSVYGIGPRVFGTFGNGRVEEFFESSALSAGDLRDPQTSRWIARRMRELHRVDISIVSGEEWNDRELVAVKRNVRDWVAPASEVLSLVTEGTGTVAGLDNTHPWWKVTEDIDLVRFCVEWDAYIRWLKRWETTHTRSPRVFAHNDAQYGNLLRLARPREGQPSHHNIIVVDFEYAAPNPAAYDIANHFQEWTADYHSPEPHILHPDRYPTAEQRRNFYLAYLSPTQPIASCTSSIALPEIPAVETIDDEKKVKELDEEVRVWSPAALAQWTVWGIVQSRDDVLAGGVGEFDYLNYSRHKVKAFRAALKDLGIEVRSR